MLVPTLGCFDFAFAGWRSADDVTAIKLIIHSITVSYWRRAYIGPFFQVTEFGYKTEVVAVWIGDAGFSAGSHSAVGHIANVVKRKITIFRRLE